MFFLDILILKIYFLIIKINKFRGDLSGISAKTATLISYSLICTTQVLRAIKIPSHNDRPSWKSECVLYTLTVHASWPSHTTSFSFPFSQKLKTSKYKQAVKFKEQEGKRCGQMITAKRKCIQTPYSCPLYIAWHRD